MVEVLPGFESERRLRAGFIGCGAHAFRNVYPVLRYVPVDLIAVCDVIEERAKTYARTFGSERVYTDHRDMLEREELDCVFVVTGYEAVDGDVTVAHARLAVDVLRAGVSVWTEKPPASTLDQVFAIREVLKAPLVYAVGFKKAFAPANRRLKAIVDDESFGRLRSLTLRYAQLVPSAQDFEGPMNEERLGFLDHLGHPHSLLRLLAGPARTMWFARESGGAGHVVFEMESGAVATLNCCPAYTWRSFGERTEVFGERASALSENNTRVVVHRSPDFAVGEGYGREADFTSVPPAQVWEPEFALGNLMNKGLFLLGYHAEIAEFCAAVLEGRQPDAGDIDYAEEGVRIFDAFRRGPNTLVELV